MRFTDKSARHKTKLGTQRLSPGRDGRLYFGLTALVQACRWAAFLFLLGGRCDVCTDAGVLAAMETENVHRKT